MSKPPTTAVIVAMLSPAVVALSGCGSHQQANTAPSSSSAAPGAQSLTAQLRTADNQPVATATFEFANGYATVTVKTTQNHVLQPGFHGLHIHSVGKCEPNSVGAEGGPPGDFMSAGMHYQAPGHTGEPASGDLTSLEVRQDGAAYLVTTSDAFTREDLLAGSKTALMLHGAQYSRDAEKRFACGVIGTG
ncbi:superoxide dismutase family protein [Candidatus Mycobacterium methanotrophicum]|uniref:Superoxide dismutase family protein n=1 Tax=Candidatus Mycobacterium methanotrophicum TaxID=2943498 RepID=A0ABY4QP38_9MYCO|nr:superoxide dismutase family protein [Candidatus Mycobacterium methanotrophicum]UQX12770.1 superoxide dismutase family protein [Candidatus Mycobacterium methanotrophicum]